MVTETPGSSARRWNRILVVSPHLDDAALGCCDHLLEWREAGSEVRVVTVFTSFDSPVVPEHQRQLMRLWNIDSVQQLRQRRVQEDVLAMRQLGVEWMHLEWVDAAFRTSGERLLYPSIRELLDGVLHASDANLIQSLSEALQRYADYDLVLVPLTVGQHVDHVIARQAVDFAFEPARRRYYVDYPYAMNPRRWNRAQLSTLFRARKSIRWTSRRKRAVLECYETQMPLLFRRKPRWFPELILDVV